MSPSRKTGGQTRKTSARKTVRRPTRTRAAERQRARPSRPGALPANRRKPARPRDPRAAGPPRGTPIAVCPSAGEVAARLFESGFNCAESAIRALLPPSPERDALTRTATGLGGGVARHGLTCGAITGCAMVASFLLGRTEAGDLEGKERTYRVVDAVFRRFQERYGTAECRRLTGFDFIAPHDEEEYNSRIKPRVCLPLLRFAVEVALEELRKAGLPVAGATAAG